MCEKILMRYGCENWRTIFVYRLAELFRSCKKIAIFFAPYSTNKVPPYGDIFLIIM